MFRISLTFHKVHLIEGYSKLLTAARCLPLWTLTWLLCSLRFTTIYNWQEVRWVTSEVTWVTSHQSALHCGGQRLILTMASSRALRSGRALGNLRTELWLCLCLTPPSPSSSSAAAAGQMARRGQRLVSLGESAAHAGHRLGVDTAFRWAERASLHCIINVLQSHSHQLIWS